MTESTQNLHNPSLPPPESDLESAEAKAQLGRVARRRASQHKKLLWAALRYFGEKGVEGGSLNEIAERADVAIGTFYSFFPSRESLVDALEAEYLMAIRRWVVAATAPIGDPFARIAARMRMSMEYAIANPAWSAFMVRNGLWLARRGLWPSPQVTEDMADMIEHCEVAMDANCAVVAVVGLNHARHLQLQAMQPDAAYPERAALHLLHCLGVPADAAKTAVAHVFERPPLPDILRETA